VKEQTGICRSRVSDNEVMPHHCLVQRVRMVPLAAVVLFGSTAANPLDVESSLTPRPPTEAPALFRIQQRPGRSADPKAELRTGLTLLVGAESDAEKAEAIRWLRRAALHGDSSAKFHLAHIYSSTDLTWRDDRKAFQLLRKAFQLLLDVAKAGDPYAAAELGSSFREGLTNRQDFRQARVWCEAAARGGLANPAWQLAWMFEKGLGVRQDLIEAYKWLDIATRLAPMPGESYELSGTARHRDELADRMSAEQISRARARSQAWLATLPPYDNCNTQQNRIRIVVSIDDPKNIEFRSWIHRFEEQLKKRLTAPPCSAIESRAVMTLRVYKGGEMGAQDTRSVSPLHYFDAAVSAALRQIRTEPLPSGFPNGHVNVRVAAFYNEMPLPSSVLKR
jgi:hypothetical protein